MVNPTNLPGNVGPLGEHISIITEVFMIRISE